MGKYPTVKILGILLFVLLIGLFSVRRLLSEHRQLSEDVAKSIVVQDQVIRQRETQKAEVKKASEKLSLAVEELNDSYAEVEEAKFQKGVASSLAEDAPSLQRLSVWLDKEAEARKRLHKAETRYAKAGESLSYAIRVKEFEEKKLSELEEKLKNDLTRPEPEIKGIRDKVISFFK